MYKGCNEIIVHCTATVPSLKTDVETVRRWHKERKFSDIGYHYLIKVDGTIELGRPIAQVGAHTKGHNANSIGVCYVGGLDFDSNPCDTRFPAQKDALKRLIEQLCNDYPITKISSHYEYARKSCPCFNASAEYSSLIQKLL